MGVAGKPFVVARTGDWCGEGVLWHPEESAVYWTDNRRDLIHRYSQLDRSIRTWMFDETVASVVLTDDLRVLCVVLGSYVLLWRPATDERKRYLGPLKDWPAVRFNEAGVDPNGALWIGSMRNHITGQAESDTGTAPGCVFRLGHDNTLTTVLTGVSVSNTIVWSPDGKHFYSADTAKNELRKYTFDLKTSRIGPPLPFLKDWHRGRPDGSAVDREGSVWNCRYGGGCVVRVSPAGLVQEIVDLPAMHITSCAFGGADLKTLFVTSAIANDPISMRTNGGLFAVQTSIQGATRNRHIICSSR